MRTLNKTPTGGHSGRGSYQNQRHPHYSHSKPLPPYAKAIEWKRREGRETPSSSVEIYTGSGAMAKASRIVDLENSFRGRCRIVPDAFAVLPFEKNPGWYCWDFVRGLSAVVSISGQPETDITLLSLVRLLIEAQAAIVCVVLSGERLEIFRPGPGGGVWRIN